MSFRLCLNTSTIKPQPMLDKIRLAAEAGFAGIELWLNDVYEYVGRGGEVSEIEKAIADHGLVVPSTIALRAWGEASALEYPLMLDEAARRMELARRLGAEWIVCSPPREPWDHDQIAERYKDLLRLGRQIGIKPTFEYISFFGSVSQLDQAWKIVQQVEDDDATIIVDAFHTWNSGSTAELLGQIPASRISHYHIDDAAMDKPPGEQTDPDRVMPGDGPIDLEAEIRMLRQVGYAGWISLELFNRQLWEEDPAALLKRGIERLRRLVDD